ncbi:MAG: response regulator [Desulfobacteraceae bacterium]|nr:response regulator [Desulfobacteraceae bacterium]
MSSFETNSRGGQILIIVIDGDPSVRRALKRLLRSAGYQSAVYASVKDFMKEALPEACLLIMDSQASDPNGCDLLKALSAKGLPIILTTAHDRQTIKARAMSSGAVAFLQKPFEDQVLLEAIREGISKALPY